MQAPRMFAGGVVRQCTRRNAHYEPHTNIPSTYNDLPQPKGDWKTNYDAHQRKYNAHLGLGIATFFGSILFGTVTGLWEFHNDYPCMPDERPNYKKVD